MKACLCAYLRIGHHPGVAVTHLPAGEVIEAGQGCLVMADFGAVYATVAALHQEGPAPRVTHAFVRRADEADAATARENERLASEAFQRLRTAAQNDTPAIKFIGAAFSHSRDRLIVFIGAPETVDLRRHTGPIQRAYKTRISIRLVGLREEAARIGGMGVCGRVICCSGWMRGARPVNVKMARIQDMPSTPLALNGACGRLKCCLAHEYEFYRSEVPRFPETGTPWIAPDGSKATVIGHNILARTLKLRTAGNRIVTIPFTPEEERKEHENPPR